VKGCKWEFLEQEANSYAAIQRPRLYSLKSSLVKRPFGLVKSRITYFQSHSK
jgi:hypothetical protein